MERVEEVREISLYSLYFHKVDIYILSYIS